jgi:non-ribosomal peptide synthetase component F
VNLVSVLLRHAQERPDAVALVDEAGAATTFAELEGAAAATAGSFRALGVTPGDRVAVAAWNDAGFVRAYLGALWALVRGTWGDPVPHPGRSRPKCPGSRKTCAGVPDIDTTCCEKRNWELS